MSQADQAVSIHRLNITKDLHRGLFDAGRYFWLQGRAPSDVNLASLDASRAQRELISQLEAKNKEIMREIARLRYTCVVYIPLYQT